MTRFGIAWCTQSSIAFTTALCYLSSQVHVIIKVEFANPGTYRRPKKLLRLERERNGKQTQLVMRTKQFCSVSRLVHISRHSRELPCRQNIRTFKLNTILHTKNTHEWVGFIYILSLFRLPKKALGHLCLHNEVFIGAKGLKSNCATLFRGYLKIVLQ